MLKRMSEIRDANAKAAGSRAEAQYDSNMVCELDKYEEEDLTPHDYVLRMALDADEKVNLMKQGLKMLLDIFAETTNNELSRSDGTMTELLTKHLDKILMLTQEFMQWYVAKSKQLDEIEAKIELAKELATSVPQLNYVGRIIVSYTDDTEQKVIAHYGGKSWRRIENFLRGVTDDDADNIPGRKLGEEYVELRESNVPVHAHSETIESASSTGNKDWSAKDKGGSTRLVNTPKNTDDTSESTNTRNTSYNYQISPLEYATKGENDLTLPHDNLPPYLRVYIWECTELTDDERKVTEEPRDDKLCRTTWLANDGAATPPVKWTCQIGKPVKYNPDGGPDRSAPEFTREGFSFDGWKCPDGITKGSNEAADDIVLGNSFYVAQWKPIKCIVTFNSTQVIEGKTFVGEPSTMVREYDKGEELGYLPTLDRLPDGCKSLIGWFDSNDTQIDKDTTVSEDITYFAKYEPVPEESCEVHFFKPIENQTYQEIYFDCNGQVSNNPAYLRKVPKGSRIGTLYVYPYGDEGHDFDGWYTASEGGMKATAAKIARNNLNLYARWTAKLCEITWIPYDGAETFTTTMGYGDEFGTLPVWTRIGYALVGWYDENGRKLSPTDKANGDATYYGHWLENGYEIEYDLKGCGKLPDGQPTAYAVSQLPVAIMPADGGDAYTFLGWTGSNGNTP